MSDTEYSIVGITLKGAEAEVGRLIAENIRYEMAMKQIRSLHGIKRSSFLECICSNFNCETLNILNSMQT